MIARLNNNQTTTAPSQTRTEHVELVQNMPWLVGRVPAGYWDELKHRQQYLRWLGNRCGFKTMEDWYQVRQRHFKINSGGGLLANVYGFSVYRAVSELFPDAELIPWKFGGVPQRFWKDVENRKWYMRWLGIQLGFKCPADWYAIRKSDFYKNQGGGLLANYFADSPQQALLEYLPSFDWTPWSFCSVPQNFWQQRENRQAFMDWLGTTLGINKTTDWYHVNTHDFHNNGGGGLLTFYYGSSLKRALIDYRPDYRWEPDRFSQTVRTATA